jgi:hypothetical protein
MTNQLGVRLRERLSYFTKTGKPGRVDVSTQMLIS